MKSFVLTLSIWGLGACSSEFQIDEQSTASAHKTKKVVAASESGGGSESPPPTPTPTEAENQEPTVEPAQPEQPQTVADVTYPQFSYKGWGQTSCKGETFPIENSIATALSSTSLVIDHSDAKITCQGACRGVANEELQKSAIGKNQFERSPVAQSSLPAHSIYAVAVIDRGGRRFSLDPPLPVFPLPAPKARYAALQSGPRFFRSVVTADADVPVSMRIRYGAVEEDDIILTYDFDIPSDQNGEIYESIPIAKQSTFRIDTKSRSVTRMITEHVWQGETHCDGRKESTRISYSLCEKKIGDKVESYVCN